MAGGISSRRGEQIQGINVTPMVDIVLVLLVIYIVASEVSQSVQPVNLPDSTHHAPIEAQNSVELTLLRDGSILMDEKSFTRDTLTAHFRSLPDISEKTIVIQADEELAHGTIIATMDALRNIGLSRFAFAVAPSSASHPPS